MGKLLPTGSPIDVLECDLDGSAPSLIAASRGRNEYVYSNLSGLLDRDSHFRFLAKEITFGPAASKSLSNKKYAVLSLYTTTYHRDLQVTQRSGLNMLLRLPLIASHIPRKPRTNTTRDPILRNQTGALVSYARLINVPLQRYVPILLSRFIQGALELAPHDTSLEIISRRFTPPWKSKGVAIRETVLVPMYTTA